MDSAGEWKRQKLRVLFDYVLREVMAIMADSHEKGAQWERDFIEMAAERNLPIEPSTGREDCVVAGLRTQCKSIDDIRGGWIDISNMRPVKSNDGFRGYLRSEVDVLALRHRGRVFLIPATFIQRDDGRLRGRVHESQLGEFENLWDVFDCNYQPPERSRQGTLFA
jgi:hypothetical protein